MLGGRKAQAFSHFTVHESGGQICVCDLQGVGGTLFTDPQIHAKGGGFGDGNLGSGGIASFLQTHQCNEICKAIGLPEPERKPRAGSGGGGGGMGGMMMPPGGMMMPPGGMGGMMLPGGGGGGGMMLMQGGGPGMSVGVNKLMQRMMEQMMAGGIGGMNLGGGGGGGNVNHRVFVNGREVDPREFGAAAGGGGGGAGGRGHQQHRAHGGGGGHGGGRHGGGDDDEDLRRALRASQQEAAADDARRLRAAIAASGGDPRMQRGGLVGPVGGGHAHPHERGREDLDLQRALHASHQQQQMQRRR